MDTMLQEQEVAELKEKVNYRDAPHMKPKLIGKLISDNLMLLVLSGKVTVSADIFLLGI